MSMVIYITSVNYCATSKVSPGPLMLIIRLKIRKSIHTRTKYFLHIVLENSSIMHYVSVYFYRDVMHSDGAETGFA